MLVGTKMEWINFIIKKRVHNERSLSPPALTDNVSVSNIYNQGVL